ncbi:hypothetical protein J1605_003405 [Eschrichtius robustus]|uniref:Uncharacterized protein n=1 Tax=Eschrichtius robustus TaxID=9764 RepID=A0AB34HST1_ESCRO|nr:hypothetical protein J1605_003405 [Eschrichtius robustus]
MWQSPPSPRPGPGVTWFPLQCESPSENRGGHPSHCRPVYRRLEPSAARLAAPGEPAQTLVPLPEARPEPRSRAALCCGSWFPSVHEGARVAAPASHSLQEDVAPGGRQVAGSPGEAEGGGAPSTAGARGDPLPLLLRQWEKATDLRVDLTGPTSGLAPLRPAPAERPLGSPAAPRLLPAQREPEGTRWPLTLDGAGATPAAGQQDGPRSFLPAQARPVTRQACQPRRRSCWSRRAGPLNLAKGVLLSTGAPRGLAGRAPAASSVQVVEERLHPDEVVPCGLVSCVLSDPASEEDAPGQRGAFDLVNIHLFHDASNLVAWETSPSVYSGIRHKALGYVLDRDNAQSPTTPAPRLPLSRPDALDGPLERLAGQVCPARPSAASRTALPQLRVPGQSGGSLGGRQGV